MYSVFCLVLTHSIQSICFWFALFALCLIIMLIHLTLRLVDWMPLFHWRHAFAWYWCRLWLILYSTVMSSISIECTSSLNWSSWWHIAYNLLIWVQSLNILESSKFYFILSVWILMHIFLAFWNIDLPSTLSEFGSSHGGFTGLSTNCLRILGSSWSRRYLCIYLSTSVILLRNVCLHLLIHLSICLIWLPLRV